MYRKAGSTKHRQLTRIATDLPANQAGIDSVIAEIEKLGRRAHGHAADVSTRGAVDELVEASVKALGPLSTMVANAGIAQVKPALEVTEEDLRRMFEVNVFGVHNCYASAATQMIKQGGGGKIIGAASIVAFKAFKMLSHYSASKFAVKGFTQAFAQELAEHKITVNAYAPGIVGTAMWDLIDDELCKQNDLPTGSRITKMSDQLISLKRTSVPEDVAKMVSFLSSPDSDYVTGQTMLCDGGIIFN